MPSHDRAVLAGEYQFSFSSQLLGGEEATDDYGLAFGEWTGRNGADYLGRYDESDWLMRQDEQSSPENFAPISREQAIARYNKEMLEMVNDVPEYVYELSLRDLVELPKIAGTARESLAVDSMRKNKPRSRTEVKNAGKRYARFESTERGGFLLKMFFRMPSSGTKSSRSSSSGSSKSGRDSSSSEPPKSGSHVKASPKPLMKVAKKAIANDSSEQQHKHHNRHHQHAGLNINCNRHQSGCYPFFLNQKKK